jgi:hypothetical protein
MVKWLGTDAELLNLAMNLIQICFGEQFRHNKSLYNNIGWSFKFILKVGVEKSIVNAPLVSFNWKHKQHKK